MCAAVITQCGAALKVGGHHVKCAAVTKEPAGSSAAGRRNRKAVSSSSRSVLTSTVWRLPASVCVFVIDVGCHFHGGHELVSISLAAHLWSICDVA